MTNQGDRMQMGVRSLPHVLTEQALTPEQARGLASGIRKDLHAIRIGFRPRGLGQVVVDRIGDDLQILLWHRDTIEAIIFAFYSARDVDYMGMSGRLVAAAWVYHIVCDGSQLDPINNEPISPPREAYALPFDIFVSFAPQFLRLSPTQRAQRLRGLSKHWRENDLTLLAVNALRRDAALRAGRVGLVRSSYIT